MKHWHSPHKTVRNRAWAPVVIMLAAFLTAFPTDASAHPEADNGVLKFPEIQPPFERKQLLIPDIGEYITLKCDLHMHTVFSDGLVWPTIRVQEAWKEGLDAIAITDHIEYQPHADDIPSNHNRAHEIAADRAEQGNILLVKGSEITRTTPPGHFNAIFTTDASGFVDHREKDNPGLDRQAIEKAAGQDAFIFWNHPGWKVDSIDGSYEWIPFVNEVHKAGMLDGIEVINEISFYRKALDWALEKDLAIMGSSDVHNVIGHDYDMTRGLHRSMTLVFARERSVEGIREALEARRSVAWSAKLIAGNEKWIRALYDASVSVGPIHATDRRGWAYADITNNSDLRFEMERVDPALTDWPESVELNPRSTRVLRFRPGEDTSSAQYRVSNAFIGGYTHLVVELSPAR